jgi:hypothetical protein
MAEKKRHSFFVLTVGAPGKSTEIFTEFLAIATGLLLDGFGEGPSFARKYQHFLHALLLNKSKEPSTPANLLLFRAMLETMIGAANARWKKIEESYLIPETGMLTKFEIVSDMIEKGDV